MHVLGAVTSLPTSQQLSVRPAPPGPSSSSTRLRRMNRWSSLAFAFGCGVATGIGLLVAHRRRRGCHEASHHVHVHTNAPALCADTVLSDPILCEHLARCTAFVGGESQQRLADAFVVVVGLGGVGSHAAHALLRSGVGRLRLVDFDQVSLSSLNRHALATREDVGDAKAVVLKEHFERILPEAKVEAMVSLYNADTREAVLSGSPDYVLDCIDHVETKADLLATCVERGLPVISACGAGARTDPTRVRMADIAECAADPLARAVRHRLRFQHGIKEGVTVVFTTEKPQVTLVPLPEEAADDPSQLQVMPTFRVRAMPVLAPVPATFGLACAAHVLSELAGLKLHPTPPVVLRDAQYERLWNRLLDREEERFGNLDGLACDKDELAYAALELWKGASARMGPLKAAARDKGTYRNTTNLTFTRWDAQKNARVDNLVLLTVEEADKHDQTSIHEVRKSEPQWSKEVEEVLQRAKQCYSFA